MKKKLLFFYSFLTILNTSLSQTLNNDSFNSFQLNSNWILVNPNPASKIQLTGNGELLIKASASNGGSDFCSCTNFNAPRILQAVNPVNNNFEVETRIRFSPTHSWQSAGIVFQISADSVQGTAIKRAAFHCFLAPKTGDLV